MMGTAAAEGAGRLGRVQLAIFWLASLVESAFYGQLIAFSPLYLPKLGVAPQESGYFCGLIASVTMFTVFPALQGWGYLSDQLTRRRVILRSYLLYAAVAAMALLAGNVWLFLISRAISLVSISPNGLFLNYLDRKGFARHSRPVYSLLALTPQLGLFLGPLAGGFLLERLGFRGVASLNLALLLAVTWAFYSRVKVMDEAPKQAALALLVSSLKTVLRSPRLCLQYLALTVLVAGWMLSLAYLPLLVSELTPAAPPGSAVGLALGLGGLAGVALSLPLIGLGKRLGTSTLLALAIAGEAGAAWLISRAGDLQHLALLWALLNGLAIAGFALLFQELQRSAEGLDARLVLSLAILPVNGGMILGPVTGSFLARPESAAVYPAAGALVALGLVSLLVASLLPVK